MEKPVFYDPTGKRGRTAKRSLGLFLSFILIGAIVFASTLFFVPHTSVNLARPLPQPHASELRGNPPRRGLRAWLPRANAKKSTAPLTVGFYQPNQDESIASLRRHIDALDWVVPTAVQIAGPEHAISVLTDPRFDSLIAAMSHPPAVLPMVQNYGQDAWDAAGFSALLRSPPARAKLVANLVAYVSRSKASGLVLDFEEVPTADYPAYVALVATLNKALPADALLAVTAPAGDPGFPLAAMARAADRVILMAYDEHWQGGSAGPIASQAWFVNQVQYALRKVPENKLIVAMAQYGYDWHRRGVDALTVEEAWLATHDSSALPLYDRSSGNLEFGYDEEGEHHSIWFADAATAWNQFAALKRFGVGAIGLWRVGSEDPDYWNALAAFRKGGTPAIDAPRAPLANMVEGNGEILRISAVASNGKRDVAFTPSGLVQNETYRVMPTPFEVDRSGGTDPKAIALTFDDGPDPTWTPRILDILKADKVPATFFVVGENAIENPGLLNRMVEEGHVLGNHTYTHPNLAGASQADTHFELGANQRLVEAYTGRSMTLFRAPYFGDAEPTTTDELLPALQAQDAGYTIVGLHGDSEDWRRPGVAAIVSNSLAAIAQATPDRTANILLLHDAGGDRSETVAALPQLISALRARGFHFVTVPQLVNSTAADAMPKVTGHDLLAVRFDVAGFLLMAAVLALISWLFFLAITLGMARAVIMAGLAWWQSRRPWTEPPEYTPSVSVLIPAYNEEKVIVSSVRRVLESDYPELRVIVIDDGSKDATSALVRQHFAHDPRVELMTLPNGGKSAALNRALARAEGEVVIALDADTQFEALTIRRLVRWFADPGIGAVAGDARVGNRVNLVTRWQAVEYITAQNLERRALAGFDAMTVVPGAVGAWRRTALDEVGGYPENTLAEDQDLTIAIQRAGWRVTYDPCATAWTESPETFRSLAKQRYRWAFGTLQCLWKHRAIQRTGRPRGLAWVGLPQAWLFQIVFAAISPLIDLSLLLSIVGTSLRVLQHGWAQTSGDVGMMGLYWLAFTFVDVMCGWVAYRLDGHRIDYPVHLLVAQRIVYRQIMYWVVLRAIGAAIGGVVVGWGKLERSGRVEGQPA